MKKYQACKELICLRNYLTYKGREIPYWWRLSPTWFHFIIFTFSKQALNESLDFCNCSQPNERHKYD